MKSLYLRLLTTDGDELDSIAVDEFAIAEEWDEDFPTQPQEDIIARVDALFTSLLTLLQERQAAPSRGRTWLKLALGEALLTADCLPEDIVLEVTVRPLGEGEDDEFKDEAE